MIELPSKLQCLFEPKRYKFIKGGRGSAKSWSVARTLLVLGAMGFERVLCTREVQKSIKQSVHQLLKDQVAALGLAKFYEVLDSEIRGLNGTQFFFAGLSDQTVDSIKSFEGCTRVWNEEGQTTTRRSWQILIPTIRADGSEIWTTYNPELDTDETHQMALAGGDDTVTVEMNYHDNPWFPQVLEDERAKAERTMAEAEYAHIWLGRTLPAVQGAIYFNEVAKADAEGRITRVPYDKLLKVHSIWDLGWNDAMSIILVQRSTSELRVIDYIEDSHKKLSDYVDMLKGEVQGKDADKHAHRKGWNYGNDWLPHDGFTKDFKTGKSTEEMLKAMGRTVARTQNMEVEQGIKAGREVFERVWFDAERAKRLVECLKRYRRNIGAKTGEAGTPLHDEFSHGADSYRYMAIDADQLKNTMTKPPRTHEHLAHGGGWMAN